MSESLTALEVGRRIGEPAERIDEWGSHGLIGSAGAAAYRSDDVERARLIQYLLRRGIELSAIAEADREQDLLARRVQQIFPAGVGRAYSISEVGEQLGLEIAAVRRMAAAAELEQGEFFYERDVEALRAFKVALDAGIPEDALLQLVRVYIDALGRVADAETRLFHYYVHERLKGLGISGRELLERVQASSDQVTPIVDSLLRYFHNKGWEKAVREDAVLHVREQAGLWEKGEVLGQLRAAICFVDLSGFTSLADAMGDETAARVLERFSQLVREATSRCDGRIVKQIGDAFMLAFPDARSGIACALEIERLTAAEPHFPAVRSGLHWGQVLYREGDYLGTCVNVAARLAAQAERHQLLLTAAARSEAGSVPGVEFRPLGQHRVRGLAEVIELFAVMPGATAESATRLIDPVCGMELDRTEAAAVLLLEGAERAFCSQQCLHRFVESPQRYAIRAPRA
jgi:class 3 adenylate cyclase/YHS domain-containing protein